MENLGRIMLPVKSSTQIMMINVEMCSFSSNLRFSSCISKVLEDVAFEKSVETSSWLFMEAESPRAVFIWVLGLLAGIRWAEITVQSQILNDCFVPTETIIIPQKSDKPYYHYSLVFNRQNNY